jgi:hypothetical protein
MDWPAAHSMDTRWFGVDDDGKVALFDSGEAGAVPEGWTGGSDGGYDLMDKLRAAGLLSLAEDDLASLPNAFYRDALGRYVDVPGPHAPERYDLLLHLAYDRVRDLLPRARRVSSREGLLLVALTGPLTVGEIDRLMQRGLVLRAWAWLEIPTATYGLHSFVHDSRWENWISGPYARHEVPREPLQLADLPASMQQMAVHLPRVSFARDEQIQPVELLPCRSWQEAWVDLQGHQHRFED